MNMHSLVQRMWSRRGPFSTVLLPLSALYCTVARRRRRRFLAAPPPSLPVPVIIVGNITVGGTGKTPLTIALCEWLRAHGWRPGVISRGYGGCGAASPRQVREDSAPEEFGDEPLLIARRTGAAVVVCKDRREAARHAMLQGCDILLADDGLQHYRLPRDIEIAMLDGYRRLGNGRCLPAGPLREPPERLREVDFVMVTEGTAHPGEYALGLTFGSAWSLGETARHRALAEFSASPVHAVAGIGHPERFFTALEEAGLRVIRHSYPDHHPFSAADLDFGDRLPVLMTEKDAVKCLKLPFDNLWAVPITVELPPAFTHALAERLRTLRHGQETA